MIRKKDFAIIVDIDGTLANNDHRRHFVDREFGLKGKKDFKSFELFMGDDEIVAPVATLMDWAQAQGASVFLITGRNEKHRLITRLWLSRNYIKYDYLYMHPDDSKLHDYEYKEDILAEIRKEFHVLFAIEDRQRCVDMWRAHKVVCLQVAEGNF